ncbi:hypothetical protein DL96DRAFT_117819 [Flagelloscypha sp. PMI_526]|nr:hypothetical protein DL96DRAFT_117819 [Flagelloscypha sp. PMI_526]
MANPSSLLMDRHALVTAVVEPFEMGVVMSMFLFGGLCFQVWSYISEYNDQIFIKILVGLTWCLVLAHNVVGITALHVMTVGHFGDYVNLIFFPRLLSISLMLSALVSTSTQCFFAYRLRKLSESLVLPVICGILALLRITGIFGIAWLARLHPNILPTQFKVQYNWLIIATMTLSASVDILVASALMITLWRRRTGVLQQAQKVVDRVILWVFQTGLLTSLSTITMVITYFVYESLTWVAIYFVTGSLFAISLLASLNARQRISEGLKGSVDGSILFPPTFAIMGKGPSMHGDLQLSSQGVPVIFQPGERLGLEGRTQPTTIHWRCPTCEKDSVNV